jgi:hypothetical protein
MLDRAMSCLTYVAEIKLRTAVAGDGEAHSIAGAFSRQTQASTGISHVAELPEFFIGRLGAFVTGSGTFSDPARAQWQAGRMNPGDGLGFAQGQKEWAGQPRFPPGKSLYMQ